MSLTKSLAVLAASLVAVTLALSQTAFAATTTISFIHLNDLHAHLVPGKALVRTGTGTSRVVEHGGIARIATRIKQIRAANPNSVLMNIGDTFHGSVESLYTEGNVIVDVMNRMGVDVGVPGNWDFAFGPGATRIRFTDATADTLGPMSQWLSSQDIHKVTYPNLGGNVTYTMPRSKKGQNFLPPTMMKTIGGVRVGFIGITSDIVPRMYSMLAMGLSFKQGQDAYLAYINQYATALRSSGAQVIVVMSELGIHKDLQLANKIAAGSVNVFFSAHTHEATFTMLTSTSGAKVVESGDYGYLGQMDITVTDGKVAGLHWQLHEITANIVEDPAIAAMVANIRAPFLNPNVNMETPSTFTTEQLTQPINTVVGQASVQLDRINALESSFNNSYTQLIRSYTGTQLAMTPGFRFSNVLGGAMQEYQDATVIDGNITLEDLYQFFPMAFSIGVGEITGANLKTLLENQLTSVFSTDAFKHSGGWVDGHAGIKVELDLSRADGSRIISMKDEQNNPIDPARNYTTTGCLRPFEQDGTLCGNTGYTNVVELLNPTQGTALTVIDAMVLSLQKNSLLMPNGGAKKFHDLSNIPQWPVSSFVQPLR